VETLKNNINKISLGEMILGFFFWKWIPCIGKSSGILWGVRHDSLVVQTYKLGEFILKMDLWDLNKKCKRTMMVVYWATQEKERWLPHYTC
jgi:hypothetical protein